jgi:hypothetical protein
MTPAYPISLKTVHRVVFSEITQYSFLAGGLEQHFDQTDKTVRQGVL